MKRTGKLPDGWLPYSPVGNQVPGTRFIAFKVPLREAFVAKLKPEDRFTIPILLSRVPDIGLIIDLTQTIRYYNKNEFLDRGVDYVKIPTPGQAVPTQQYVDRFFEVVDYYLESHKDDDSLIGVHCTHGVNRTGYMLSRYLIQRLGYSFEEAVDAVGTARGHMIERSPYLASLQSHRDIVKKKTIRGDLEEGKPKMPKKLGKPPKKVEPARPVGKERFARRDNYSSPSRGMGRRSRSPHPNRGPNRTRPSPIRFDDRELAPQGRGDSMIPPNRDRQQGPSVRDRLQPPLQRSQPPMRGMSPHHMGMLSTRGRGTPPHMRGRTPPPGVRSGSPGPEFLERGPSHVQGRTHQSPHMRGRSPPLHLHGRSPPPHLRTRTPPPPHMRGRTPPLHIRGRTPPPHMRGRSPPPPPHMRGRTPPHMRGRSPPPPHMRGRSPPPPQMRGRSPPQHMRGRSPPPPHMRGRTPPPHMRGRTPPPHMRGRTPPQGFRSRTPPPVHMMRGRTPPPNMKGRSPPPMAGRNRSPRALMRGSSPSMHIRGRTPPPSHVRGRTPPGMSTSRAAPPMRGRTPPPQGPLRGRSPQFHGRGRSSPPPRGRTPPHVQRGRSPVERSGRGRSPRRQLSPLSAMNREVSPPIISRGGRSPNRGRSDLTSGHAYHSTDGRRETFPPQRGRTPPQSRREPSPRGRSPPPLSTRRSPIPEPRREMPPPDAYYKYRDEYDHRRSTNDSNREYHDKQHSAPAYVPDPSVPPYYPEKYDQRRSERIETPRDSFHYPGKREGRKESPSRDLKRRRKSPGDIRDKSRRDDYINGRESLADSRSYPLEQWDLNPDPDGPDCREILNEKRSIKDPYTDEAEYDDQRRTAFVDALPLKNVDLRVSLEEEKRRKQSGYAEQAYGNEEYLGGDRKKPRREYSEGGYLSNPGEKDYDEYPGQYSHRSDAFPPGDTHRQPYPRYPDGDGFVKTGEHVGEEFRRPRGRGGKRVFDRLSRGSWRGRGSNRM